MSYKEKWRNFWKVKEQQTENAVPNTDLSELETPEERKLRIRGLWICHVVTFVFSLSFSIVFTGVFPYLQQVTLLIDAFYSTSPRFRRFKQSQALNYKL